MRKIDVGVELVSFAGARALDKEASEQWGLNSFALVEAAGRACAEVFSRTFLRHYQLPTTNYPLLAVLAGTGNNAADALVMLRALVLEGRVLPSACTVFTATPHSQHATGNSPLSSALTSVQMLGIPVMAWEPCTEVLQDRGSPLQPCTEVLQDRGSPLHEQKKASLETADFIIDGIVGTGLNSQLCGTPLPTPHRPQSLLKQTCLSCNSGSHLGSQRADSNQETQLDAVPSSVAPLPNSRRAVFQMVEAVNALRRNRKRPCIVSVDIPSGVFDGWRPGMPAVTADATLAIEPQKLCLYTPSARPYAGKILPVGGIFPAGLVAQYSEAELVSWKNASQKIPRFPETAYKYTRGLVEIRAGSPGAAGAAKLAALGAQSAGAGLVRLIVDPSLYPVVAPTCSGIMAVPDTPDSREERFSPSAVLLGPGWGRGEDRRRLLETYLPLEEKGLPLILDADAIVLAKDIVFHGNTVLTPHPGEFAEYTGIPKDEILADPVPILRRTASEKKVHILFKGHVMYAVSPDGRIGIIDGMNPLLAAGGSGDVLAGFCAAIAARSDGYACMCAAASLLIKAAKSKKVSGRFVDPETTAKAAAVIAGKAWLPII